MKLTTGGKASLAFRDAVVGKVAREYLPEKDRSQRILVTDEVPEDSKQLIGYSGFLTRAKLERELDSIPTISSVQAIDHLRSNDIVAMEPGNGFIRTLYRPDSDHNVIFATERCNSNCLMCSQPPQDRDDTDPFVRRNLELIKLIE